MSLKQTNDLRWDAALTGLRVLCWLPHEPYEAYGEITGYDHAKQSFYIAFDVDQSGEVYFLHWDSVRPA